MSENAGTIFFSIIIPLYNRPEEIRELLASLTVQTYRNFEVVIIEDGSKDAAEEVINGFRNELTIQYFVKENSGQGFSRNYGFERAKGDFFIIFDSDILVPPDYLEIVNRGVKRNQLDLYGGPDAAHTSFSPVQKAISYAMTSFFTTGGIRGRKKRIGGTFHPRSFNMGVSREAWEKAGGFLITRMGEDIEFSIRLQKLGFKSALIPEAFVYHKRRSTLGGFYKQVHFFGRARINIYTFFPSELKLVHFFPLFFTSFLFLILLSLIFSWYMIFNVCAAGLLIYSFALVIDAFIRYRSVSLAFLCLRASFVQLTGYGIGFLTEILSRIVSKKN